MDENVNPFEEWKEIFKWAEVTRRESRYDYAHPCNIWEVDGITSFTPRERHERLWVRLDQELEFNTWQLAEFVLWVKEQCQSK